jgi:hypothetical protein
LVYKNGEIHTAIFQTILFGKFINVIWNPIRQNSIFLQAYPVTIPYDCPEYVQLFLQHWDKDEG